MHIHTDDLIATLRAHGLRITEPRRLVCAVIATRHDEHLTAATIFEGVQSEGDGELDMATVYRTLDVLEEAGVVKHGHIGHGPTVYHLTDEPEHQHLVCSECGRTEAISSDDIGALVDGITQRTGFVPNIEHFALTGLCHECATRQATR